MTNDPNAGNGRSATKGVVLVVDDVPTVREALRMALTDAGFEVATAADGGEALVLAAAQPFDAIVSDLCMPELDGLELLQTIRARDREVPVVLMTSSPDLASAIRAVEFGALRYLVKPVQPDELVEVVGGAVRLRRLAQINRQALEVAKGSVGRAADRIDLEARFERALGSIRLAYQPIVLWSRQEVFGWEALLRSDEESLSNALGLIHAAERLGRVHDVGRIARACAADGVRDLVDGTTLFVNVHPHDLDDESLYDPESPLSRVADRVVLEITERAELDTLDNLEGRVEALRALGFRIALDDLGAGYASLNSFAQLKPEIVKIDMEIVQGADQSPTRARVIEKLAQLCGEMKVCLIGEGIETIEERDKVAELGCDLLQGFFFARPGGAFPGVAPEAFDPAERAAVG